MNLQYMRQALHAFVKPSLETITTSVVKRHYSKNAVLRNNAYGCRRRAANWLKSNKYTAAACLIGVYLLVIGLAAILYPLEFGPRVPDNVTDFYRDLQTINLAVLAAQATFVGLVFPIVIALVGLMSEGRISYRGRLNLFLAETESVLVGTSALLLIVALLGQLLALSQLPARVGAAVTAVNIVWFALNTYAIGFFLFQTLRYVQSDLRHEIEKRYIANVVWRNQLTKLVRTNRWSAATHYGYWPDAETTVGNKDEAPLIVTYQFHNKSDYSLDLDRRAESEVRDVRIHLVGVVLEHWLIRYRNAEDRSHFAWLEFCLGPQMRFSGKKPLVRITSAPSLSTIDEFFFKRAFKIRRAKNQRDAGNVVQFIDEMVTDLMRLAEDGRSSEFRTLLKQLTELHAFLFHIAEAPKQDETFNYAQMSDAFGRDLSTTWAAAYRDLHKKVASKLDSDADLFESVAWWSPNIVGLAKASAFDAVASAALISSSHLLRRLLDWASDEHKMLSGEAPNAGGSFDVPARLQSAYATAWRSYVASWERLLDAWSIDVQSSDEPDLQWEKLRAVHKAFQEHLLRTAEHVALCTASGDRLAVLWSTDLLLKWQGRSLSVHSKNVTQSVQPDLITVSTFKRTWSDTISLIRPEYPLGDRMGDWVPNPNSIWDAAFENLWSDSCAALLAVQIRWAISLGGEGQAIEASKRILRGELHDQGWRGIRESREISFETLLTTPLRITAAGYGGDEEDYAGVIAGLMQRLLDIGSPQFVSMRIYSGSGSDDYLSLTVEQVLLLAARVKVTDRQIRVSREARTLFDEAKDDAARRRIIEHLRTLRTTIEAMDLEALGPIVLTLRETNENIGALINAVDRHLEAYISTFEEVRNERFGEAEIDDSRLQEISQAASSLGFSKETGAFPVSAFEVVELTDDQLTDFTLKSTNHNTGEFTDPPFGHPVSNEQEFWANALKLRAAAIVMNDLIKAIEPSVLVTSTAQAFWSALQSCALEIRDNGLHPILIVPSQVEPEWLIDWSWSTDETKWKPDSLRIWRNEAEPEGYCFNLNDLPVFEGPIQRRSAFVIPRESLSHLQFTQFDNRPVETVFERHPDDPWKGDLKIKFARSATVDDGPKFRLTFSRTGEDAE